MVELAMFIKIGETLYTRKTAEEMRDQLTAGIEAYDARMAKLTEGEEENEETVNDGG